MNGSPSSKRIKLESPSSPEEDQQQKDADELDQEHCTICLQSFLDRTIIPVCAHEFCFDCILLWSEQSRKCPLCSRSFDDSYLIHRVRSQFDYQKYYLPPLRSSPPPLTRASRANALRNTRRERQWGRRQRQEREEADQLERAIARRRWIYQHHLYAKHVASNPYTRYRPFPTPAQFAASPDLISRMSTFLRRELRAWPNLDVEFLTTYTISLMKSIDIRSESAVKLLSEFLDLDTPYTAGARHVNAEHFAHEIYSYLRSPYRDLNTYDQTAQYDTPPEISSPQEIERGSRWDAEPSASRRSRSRSSSRHQSPVPRREINAMRSPVARHGRASSAEVCYRDELNDSHGPTRSSSSREDRDSRNRPFDRRRSSADDAQDILRDGRLGGLPPPEPLSSVVPTENQGNDDSSVEPHFQRDDQGKARATEAAEDVVIATDTLKMGAPQGDDSAAALTAQKSGVTCFIDGPHQEVGDTIPDYVDNGSSAKAQPSRKSSAGSSVHYPRNRTLSESIQAYLTGPAVPGYRRKKPIIAADEQPTRTSDMRLGVLRRVMGGPTRPATGKLPSLCKATVGTAADGASTPNDNTPFEQSPPHDRRAFSSNHASFTGVAQADGDDCPKDGALGPSRADKEPFSVADASASLDEQSRTDVDTRTTLAGPAGSSLFHVGERAGRGVGSATTAAGDSDCDCGGGGDALPSGEAALASRPGGSGFGCGSGSKSGSGSGSGVGVGVGARDGSGSMPASVPKSSSQLTDAGVDVRALETRLRARARVRVRLEALKSAMGGDLAGSGSGVVPGMEER